MKYGTLLLALVCACLGTGSAMADDKAPQMSDILSAQTGQNGRECVLVNDIRGYGYQDRVLTMDARGGYYVATTLFRCHDLESSTAAAFNGTFGEICGGGGSSVGRRLGRCPIGKVFKFDNRQQAFEALDQAKQTLSDAGVIQARNLVLTHY